MGAAGQIKNAEKPLQSDKFVLKFFGSPEPAKSSPFQDSKEICERQWIYEPLARP